MDLIGTFCGVYLTLSSFISGIFPTFDSGRSLCKEYDSATDEQQYKVVCYYGSGSRGRFPPSIIDVNLCTHINYAFARIDNGVLVPALPAADLPGPTGNGTYQQATDLKKLKPSLKLILSIANDYGNWSAAVASEAARSKLAIQSANFLKKYSFDGMDLDWEFPNNTIDRKRFTLLVKGLRKHFDKIAPEIGKRLLLTLAVSARKREIDVAYDVPQLSKYVDFMNLMGYDFFYYNPPNMTVTGIHTTLYPPAGSPIDDPNNVAFAVQYMLSKGCPAAKLILGMGLYGRTFTLQDPEHNAVGDNATASGAGGSWRTYRDIATDLNAGWSFVYRDDMKACYSYKGDQWVGFDSPKSIAIKAEYVKQEKLGGAMVWSIEQDDTTGAHSGGQKFPLMTAINQVLNNK